MSDQAVIGDERTGDLLIFVLGTLQDLKDHGLVEGGCVRLSQDAMKRYRELVDAKFDPGHDEVRATLDYIQSEHFYETVVAASKPA